MPVYRLEIDRRPVERAVIIVECEANELTHGRVFGDMGQENKIIKQWDSVFANVGNYVYLTDQSQFVTEIKEI